MDIDFLKNQTKKRKVKARDDSALTSGIEYANIASASAKPQLIKPEKKQEPPPAPVKKIKKISWWQKLKNSLASKKTAAPGNLNTEKIEEKKLIVQPEDSALIQNEKPKAVEPVKKPSLPVQKKVPVPVPKPVVEQAAPPVAAQPKKIRKEEGVFLPPEIIKKEIVSELTSQEQEKYKKGEFSKGFLNVNLIPADLEARLKPFNIYKKLIYATATPLIIVLIVYGAMIWYQNKLWIQVKQTQEEISRIESEIISNQSWQKEAIAFNQKISDITSILDEHIYWTAFFQALEGSTLPEVKYDNLNGGVNGTFTMSASAPNYETVSRQIAIFEQTDFIKSVSINTASLSGAESNKSDSAEETSSNLKNKVHFNISLTVKPDVFYIKHEL